MKTLTPPLTTLTHVRTLTLYLVLMMLFVLPASKHLQAQGYQKYYIELNQPGGNCLLDLIEGSNHYYYTGFGKDHSSTSDDWCFLKTYKDGYFSTYREYDFYNGGHSDQAYAIDMTINQSSQQQFYISGQLGTSQSADHACIISVDDAGNVVWAKEVDNDNSTGKDVVCHENFGVYMSGIATPTINSGNDVLLSLHDFNGNTQFIKTYGLPNAFEEAVSIDYNFESDLVITGKTNNSGINDPFLTIIDPASNLKQFIVIHDNTNQDHHPLELVQTEDGGYLILMRRNTGDLVLMKINFDLTINWVKKYTFTGFTKIEPTSVKNTAYGHAIVTGYIGNTSPFLMKIDKDGNVRFLKVYSLNNGDTKSKKVIRTDKGYVIAGFTKQAAVSTHDLYFSLVTDQLGNSTISDICQTQMPTYTIEDLTLNYQVNDLTGNILINSLQDKIPVYNVVNKELEEDGCSCNLDVYFTSTHEDCMPGPADVTAHVTGGSGSYDFNWSNGSITPTTSLPFGIAIFRVTDHHTGCILEAEVNVGRFDYPDGYTVSPGQHAYWTGLNGGDFRGVLDVQPGGSMQMNGTVLNFWDTKQDVIKTYVRINAGGSMILDNSWLTERCGYNWDGVELYGNHLLPQPSPYLPDGTLKYNNPQGFLHLKNNSAINHARLGVLVGTPGNARGTGGGILFADDSRFHNNRISTWFRAYTFKNRSYFNDNLFECTAPMNNTAEFNYLGVDRFVVMKSIKDIMFWDNDFQTTYNFGEYNRGTGISSSSSSYSVGKGFGTTYPQTWKGNTFSNLSKGVDDYSVSPLNNVVIRANAFNNTFQNITLNGSTFNSILQNAISMPDAGGPCTACPLPPEWGMYLLSSNGYLAAENRVNAQYNGTHAPPLTKMAWGTISRNSNGPGGEIYGNTFGDIDYHATQAEQDNTALVIQCNTYNNNYRDWGVTSGILADQGIDCFYPGATRAYNIFHSGCTAESHVKLHPLHPVLNYYSLNNQGVPDINCISTNVVVHGCPDGDNSCNSKTGGPKKTPGQLRAAIDSASGLSRQLLISELLRLYLDEGQETTALHYLDSLPGNWAHKLAVKAWLHRGNATRAQTAFDSVQVITYNDQQFKTLWQPLIYAVQAGTPLYDLDSSSLAHVELLADSTTPAGIQAQALLALNNDTVYWRIPESLPYLGGNLRVGIFDEADEYKWAELDIKPNPNQGSFEITYSIPGDDTECILAIIDLTGRVVYQKKLLASWSSIFINLQDQASGLYQCRLVWNGKLLASKKLIITKH